MKMMIIIIIIIIIARFSKIEIHLKSIKKVKQRISLERRCLAPFEVLIAHFLCVKITISFVFFFTSKWSFDSFLYMKQQQGVCDNAYKQVRNKILVLMSLVITSMVYNFLCHHHSWEHDKGTDNYQCCHVSHRPSL